MPVPFKQWVRGSNPRRVTMKSSESDCFRNFLFVFLIKKVREKIGRIFGVTDPLQTGIDVVLRQGIVNFLALKVDVEFIGGAGVGVADAAG